MGSALAERIRGAGGPSYGTWISVPSLVTVDALRGLGFDWFVLDTEHAQLNPETIAGMIALLTAAGAVPLVRVGATDLYFEKQALDAGAHGVVVPLVNSEEEARAAVRHAKYPPDGDRGIAAAAATRYGLELPAYLARANGATTVAVQIETRAALERVEAIAAVPGVDILFVGPQDLTLSLGLGTERTHPTVRAALRRVAAAAEAHGLLAGTLAVTPEEKRTAVALGFRFVALASDVRFLIQGARAFLEA